MWAGVYVAGVWADVWVGVSADDVWAGVWADVWAAVWANDVYMVFKA